MAHDSQSLRDEAHQQALRAERDAALSALETRERDAQEQIRLLVEEQDRFVSRMIEAHERAVSKLRLELEEARMSAARFEQKLERDRASAVRLEDDLAQARAEIVRLREQRDAARRSQQGYVTAHATIEELRRELDLARSMLADAMAGRSAHPAASPEWQGVEPRPSAHEAVSPARESGIVGRWERRAPGVKPPLPVRREPTKAALGGARDSGPPSSR